ncbi:MAG TPA: hypothetical protein VN458_08215 [Solirubrobacterales bacterium]|nr:hypothetical protein [Solirubrobacterales bacterium]
MSVAFVIAPTGDRTLTVGAYVGGVLELAVVLAALAFGAYRVRALLLPGWSGAPARLAEGVLGVAGLIWVCEAVGTFGGFKEGIVLGALVVTGLAAGLVATRLADSRPARSATGPPAPPTWGLARAVAVLTCAALAAAWMVPTLGTLAAGMDRADSLWYHMPLAARFVQTGYLGHIEFFDPIFLASFYPANSEVLHAVPILFTDRDSVSPLLNLGWLSAALLAAWCIGRPYGFAPQALIGASLALGSQSLVEFQAGEALNDITGLAFLLAAVALLVNGYASARGPDSGRTIAPAVLAVAGIAAGLAAGTKLSFLAPVAALTIAVVVIAQRSTRLRAAAFWGIPMLAAGGYWYVRNLIAVGNPIPYIGSLGPISLPAPDRDFQLRPDFAVVHYWNDTDVWRHWFAPGLNDSFGTLWPLTLVAMVVVCVLAVWRGREPILRALGGVVAVTAIAYLFTPLTAAGEEGEPISFVWNVRYLAPAVAIGLAILPCLPALRATPRRRAAVLAGLTVLLAFTVGSLVQWDQGHTKGAVAAAALVIGAAVVVWILRSRGTLAPPIPRRIRASVAVAALVAAVAAGYAEQHHYLTHRYEDTGRVQDLAGALRWSRDVRDARIAIGGIRGVFTQYPFYGTDLSNRVQWLGLRGPHDAYLRIPNCREWRSAINAGGYTHVVTTFDPYLPGTMRNSPEGRWTESDPNARVVLRDGPVRVFELRGPLDPAGCTGQRPLTEAQLHSVPNLSGTPSKND